MKKNLIYLSAIMLAVITFACSCSSKSASVQPSTAPTATSVKIQNFAFVPDTMIVKTGTTITWTNVDAAPHTVTDLTGAFGSTNLATNATFKFAFTTPGTFTYHCTVHPMMKNAVVIVMN